MDAKKRLTTLNPAWWTFIDATLNLVVQLKRSKSRRRKNSKPITAAHSHPQTSKVVAGQQPKIAAVIYTEGSFRGTNYQHHLKTSLVSSLFRLINMKKDLRSIDAALQVQIGI